VGKAVYAQSFNFPFNDTMTTPYGPAYADIILEPSNFLPCEGGPIALCYYSGPEPETCVLSQDGTTANCECFEISYGKYFVDINAILNLDVYNETIAQCGTDGSGCQATNSAPVCESINNGTFSPGTDMISAFSFACVPEEGIGSTNCTQPPLQYAGCMTAPCSRTGEDGIVNCLCPTYEGPYQIGLNDQTCNLGNNMTWSAAYNPNVTGTTPTPPIGGCIPDAPESLGGCPLLTRNDIPKPPPNIDCDEVCQEYQDCHGAGGIKIGYTCDATLCTSQCNDRDLVGLACDGLQSCEVTEIIKLEAEVGCSCCASQICGCAANNQTQKAVFDLNNQQRDRGITPQCDINGTLCGGVGIPVYSERSLVVIFGAMGLISIFFLLRRKKSARRA
jgi:hypothetical protein